MSATPRPWFVARQGCIASAVKTPGSMFIAEVHHRDDPIEVEANARLIVTAVNAHEELLVLLTEFNNEWAAQLPGCADAYCKACADRDEFLARVRAAISKASPSPAGGGE